MTATTESLLEAIKILNQKMNSKLDFDKTIQAKVVEQIDLSTGKYLINYQGGEFTAYSQDLGKIYSIDEIVYVKIPGGDLSNKKIIEGYGEINKTLNVVEKEKLQKYSFNMVKDLFKDEDPIGIIAGINHPANGSEIYFYENDNRGYYVYGNKTEELDERLKKFYKLDSVDKIDYDATNFDVFKSYMQKYDTLLFSNEVKTQFNFEIEDGKEDTNYGIIITLWPSKLPDATNYPTPISISFTAKEEYNGNIFGFSSNAYQSKIVEYASGDYDAISFLIYEQNFKFSDRNGEQYKPDRKNIFLSNIGMYFVSSVGEIPYNIDIANKREYSAQDEDGVNEIETNILTPTLFYGSTEIPNDKIEWKWYYYKKNGVVENYINYNPTLGKDWVYITQDDVFYSIIKDEETKESKLSFSLFKNNPPSWKKKIFKAVAIYNETNEIVSNEFFVENSYNNVTFYVTGDSIDKTLSFNTFGNFGSIYTTYEDYVPYWEYEGNIAINSLLEENLNANHPYIWNIPPEVFSLYANRDFYCVVQRKKVDSIFDLESGGNIIARIAFWEYSYQDSKAFEDLKERINDSIANLETSKQIIETALRIRNDFYITKTCLLEEEPIDKIEYTFTANYDKDINGEMELPISGIDTFYYDNSGRLQADKRNYNITFPLSIEESDGEFSITDIEIYWKEENENLDNLIQPKNVNTMIKSIDACGRDLDESKDKNQYKINFTIEPNFKNQLALNNYFTIRYKYRGKYRIQRHYINFLLNGQLGTNGTGWYAVIEGNDILTLDDTTLTVDENNNLINGISFNLEVYKDGELSGDYSVINISEYNAEAGSDFEKLNIKSKVNDSTGCNIFYKKEQNNLVSTLYANWEAQVFDSKHYQYYQEVMGLDKTDIFDYWKAIRGNKPTNPDFVMNNYDTWLENLELSFFYDYRDYLIEALTEKGLTPYGKQLMLAVPYEGNYKKTNGKEYPGVKNAMGENIANIYQAYWDLTDALYDLFIIDDSLVVRQNIKSISDIYLGIGNNNDANKIVYKQQKEYVNQILDNLIDNGIREISEDGTKVYNYPGPVYFKLEIETSDGYTLVIYHPITVIYSKKEEKDENNNIISLPKIITNLPNTVMFDTNGYNANWSSTTELIINNNNSFSINAFELIKIINKTPTYITENRQGFLPQISKIEYKKQDDKEIYSNYRLIPPDHFYNKEDRFYDVMKIRLQSTSGKMFLYYKTIIYHLNRYGNDTINGWDGQKLVIKQAEGEDSAVILAPTIGAGRKHEDNSFSGVVMGIDPQQDLTGLYGYQKGERTFALSEDGNAYFKGDIVANSLTLGEGVAGQAGIATSDELNNINNKVDKFESTFKDVATEIVTANMGDNYVKVDFKYGDDNTKSFYVTKDGLLDAKNAIIRGTVYAGGGEIGNWSITNGALYNADKNIVLDPNPNNTIKIGNWNFNSNYDGSSSQSAMWSQTPTINGYYYRTIVKTSDRKYGHEGIFAINKYDSNGRYKGQPFVVNYDGSVVASAMTINGGAINGSAINGGSISIGETIDPNNTNIKGSLVIDKTGENIRIFSGGKDQSPGNIDIGVFTGNMRLSSNTGENSIYFSDKLSLFSWFGSLSGAWTSTSGYSITSDLNKKHEITTLDSQYTKLFDNLHPVTYKYNDGTSDRLHTGFIAQEVKEALDNAEIDTKDFAGLVIFNRDTEDELWTLRYEEFIALNTSEIQKAKTRIIELEARVSQLENLLQANLD